MPCSVRMPDVYPVVAGVGDVLDADLVLDVGYAAPSDHSDEYLLINIEKFTRVKDISQGYF